MVDIKQKQQQRFLFLKKLYELAEDNRSMLYTYREVGELIGIDPSTAEKAARFLQDQGLVKILSRDGSVAITHEGDLEVEAALAEPEKPTEYFPPVFNLIQINAPSNGFSIQQGTTNSAQTNTISVEQGQDLSEIIVQLKQLQDSLNLSRDEQEELASDVQTLEAQLTSPKPKITILRETLRSIKSALGKATTQIASHTISKTIQTATPPIMEEIDRWLTQNPS